MSNPLAQALSIATPVFPSFLASSWYGHWPEFNLACSQLLNLELK
uniref:Uncharacterized protein n=1 Tax=Anguilla anguilla TaxID=7936 RepID=A0A0E9U1I7_ANGAN